MHKMQAEDKLKLQRIAFELIHKQYPEFWLNVSTWNFTVQTCEGVIEKVFNALPQDLRNNLLYADVTVDDLRDLEKKIS